MQQFMSLLMLSAYDGMQVLLGSIYIAALNAFGIPVEFRSQRKHSNTGSHVGGLVGWLHMFIPPRHDCYYRMVSNNNKQTG
jgi:hypothetical protein